MGWTWEKGNQGSSGHWAVFGLGFGMPNGSCHSDQSVGGGAEESLSLCVGGDELTVSVGHLS